MSDRPISTEEERAEKTEPETIQGEISIDDEGSTDCKHQKSDKSTEEPAEGKTEAKILQGEYAPLGEEILIGSDGETTDLQHKTGESYKHKQQELPKPRMEIPPGPCVEDLPTEKIICLTELSPEGCRPKITSSVQKTSGSVEEETHSQIQKSDKPISTEEERTEKTEPEMHQGEISIGDEGSIDCDHQKSNTYTEEQAVGKTETKTLQGEYAPLVEEILIASDGETTNLQRNTGESYKHEQEELPKKELPKPRIEISPGPCVEDLPTEKMIGLTEISPEGCIPKTTSSMLEKLSGSDEEKTQSQMQKGHITGEKKLLVVQIESAGVKEESSSTEIIMVKDSHEDHQQERPPHPIEATVIVQRPQVTSRQPARDLNCSPECMPSIEDSYPYRSRKTTGLPKSPQSSWRTTFNKAGSKFRSFGSIFSRKSSEFERPKHPTSFSVTEEHSITSGSVDPLKELKIKYVEMTNINSRLNSVTNQFSRTTQKLRSYDQLSMEENESLATEKMRITESNNKITAEVAKVQNAVFKFVESAAGFQEMKTEVVKSVRELLDSAAEMQKDMKDYIAQLMSHLDHIIANEADPARIPSSMTTEGTSETTHIVLTEKEAISKAIEDVKAMYNSLDTIVADLESQAKSFEAIAPDKRTQHSTKAEYNEKEVIPPLPRIHRSFRPRMRINRDNFMFGLMTGMGIGGIAASLFLVKRG